MTAEWGPVQTSTYHLGALFPAVEEAMTAGPTAPEALHSWSSLETLLPIGAVGPEDVWELDPAKLTPFLAQLHPGVRTRLRHRNPAVEGGRATLLRATPEELEILLRVHVEFELLPDELHFLPAQFEGRLVWDCVNLRPKSFHLALPPRDTNYDLNYRNSIDIGYLPLMQVSSEGATRASGPEAEAARARLRASFYPSDRIEWHSLEEALARAKKSGRRLHVMQLFGTLDDESC
jgi:hypothetical protein